MCELKINDVMVVVMNFWIFSVFFLFFFFLVGEIDDKLIMVVFLGSFFLCAGLIGRQ